MDEYAKWYGGEHKAPDLQKEAVYGLTEIYREQVLCFGLALHACRLSGMKAAGYLQSEHHHLFPGQGSTPGSQSRVLPYMCTVAADSSSAQEIDHDRRYYH